MSTSTAVGRHSEPSPALADDRRGFVYSSRSQSGQSAALSGGRVVSPSAGVNQPPSLPLLYLGSAKITRADNTTGCHPAVLSARSLPAKDRTDPVLRRLFSLLPSTHLSTEQASYSSCSIHPIWGVIMHLHQPGKGKWKGKRGKAKWGK